MLKKIVQIHTPQTQRIDNSIFITFDIDWAHDEILNDTIDLVESANVSATWFITHETKVLNRLRSNPKFELGIHPNFNPLLENSHSSTTTAKDTVQKLMGIVPEAKCVRSHSMTKSSKLSEIFKKFGLTHELNIYIPAHTGIRIKPWILPNGLIQVPYNWEDDVYLTFLTIQKVKERTAKELALNKRIGLKVFDFHPIHIFLNSESMDRYEKTRHLHKNPKELKKYRYKGYGIRTQLLELLDLAKNK